MRIIMVGGIILDKWHVLFVVGVVCVVLSGCVESDGDLTVGGDVNATGGFIPPYVSQSAQPTPDTGGMVMWHDTDDDKVYYVFNDPTVGVKTVELT